MPLNQCIFKSQNISCAKHEIARSGIRRRLSMVCKMRLHNKKKWTDDLNFHIIISDERLMALKSIVIVILYLNFVVFKESLKLFRKS